MFDDQNPKPTSPTGGGVEDIFEGVGAGSVPTNLPTAKEKPSSAPAPTPTPASRPVVQPAPAPTPATKPPVQSMPTSTSIPTAPVVMPKKQGSGAGKVIMIVVAAILIIALSGFLAYKFIMQAPVDVVEEDDTEEPTQVDEIEVECDAENPCSDDLICVDNECVTPPEPVESEEIDSDGDGLTDAEELAAGIDPDDIDTDDDGLGDREEVQVYDTDPLNADTDEDSYLDGQEVKGGYNPNGAGKLFELPK